MSQIISCNVSKSCGYCIIGRPNQVKLYGYLYLRVSANHFHDSFFSLLSLFISLMFSYYQRKIFLYRPFKLKNIFFFVKLFSSFQLIPYYHHLVDLSEQQLLDIYLKYNFSILFELFLFSFSLNASSLYFQAGKSGLSSIVYKAISSKYFPAKSRESFFLRMFLLANKLLNLF